MRTEGGKFGIQSSKTLRKNGLRSQEYKLSNLDPTSAAILEGIKVRHEDRIAAAQPPSQEDEQKH